MLDFSFASFLNGTFDLDSRTGTHKTPVIHAKSAETGTKKGLYYDPDYLRGRPDVEVVTVTGMDQAAFERFIRTYGKQLRAIRFFKNKAICDWSLLAELPEIEYLDFYQNHRLTSLWDMRGNVSLSGLSVKDFNRFTSIDGIASAPALKYVSIGNTVIRKMKLESLAPLAGSGIEYFSYSGKDLGDRNLSFLFEMPALKTFDFPSNLYDTEEVAWISANFPELTGVSIRPYIEFTEKNGGDGSEEDVRKIVGKNKPLLIFRGNEERLHGYARAFEELKERFTGISYEEAFGKKTAERRKKKRFVLKKRSSGKKRKEKNEKTN